MDSIRSRQEKYEGYIDATVELFMDSYSDILTANIRKEMDELENQEIEIPAQLHERCIDLIAKENKKRRNQKTGKQIMRGLRMVAVFALVMLSLTSVLFVTVEAFRTPIINFFIERNDRYWVVTNDENGDLDTYGKNIDWADPLSGLLAEEYELVLIEKNSNKNAVAVYENADAEEIFFSLKPADSAIQLDSEDIQYSKELEICGYDAVLVVEDDCVTLIWIHSEFGSTITLIADGLTEAEVVDIAEQFTIRSHIH